MFSSREDGYVLTELSQQDYILLSYMSFIDWEYCRRDLVPPIKMYKIMNVRIPLFIYITAFIYLLKI